MIRKNHAIDHWNGRRSNAVGRSGLDDEKIKTSESETSQPDPGQCDRGVDQKIRRKNRPIHERTQICQQHRALSGDESGRLTGTVEKISSTQWNR